jgi:hypothetical protein
LIRADRTAQQNAIAAREAANAATLNAKVISDAERAYVKMSHPRPGIKQFDEASGHIWFTISVKNYGRTPAKITDVIVKPIVVPHGDALPAEPDYSVDNWAGPLRAFLVTNDEFFDSRFYRISADDAQKVKDLIFDLYMIGFVDYIDQFGGRHRGGYARIYYPMVDAKSADRYPTEAVYAVRNNLGVVAKEGYNYDRPRHRGEGNDWKESC